MPLTPKKPPLLETSGERRYLDGKVQGIWLLFSWWYLQVTGETASPPPRFAVSALPPFTTLAVSVCGNILYISVTVGSPHSATIEAIAINYQGRIKLSRQRKNTHALVHTHKTLEAVRYPWGEDEEEPPNRTPHQKKKIQQHMRVAFACVLCCEANACVPSPFSLLFFIFLPPFSTHSKGHALHHEVRLVADGLGLDGHLLERVVVHEVEHIALRVRELQL